MRQLDNFDKCTKFDILQLCKVKIINDADITQLVSDRVMNHDDHIKCQKQLHVLILPK